MEQLLVKPTFHKQLARTLDKLKERIYVKKKASLVIIDGYQGEGKTTLGVQCADYYQQKEINLKEPEQLSVGGKDFQKKFEICIEKGFVVIIYDEAGDLDKYSTYTDFNKTMTQFFRMFRTYKILVIMILPNFNDLDPRLFKNGIPRLLIHCHGKTETEGHFKVYNLYRMEWLRLKLKMYANKMLPQEVYKYVRPNFQGEFKDLSPERSKLLDKISAQGKSDIRTQTRIKENKLKSVREISQQIGRSILWVKLKLKDLKIQPTMKHKITNYYEESVVNRLEGERKK